ALALGHVEPADEEADAAPAVEDCRARGRQDAVAAVCGAPAELLLRGGRARRELGEDQSRGVAVLGYDEHLPEEPAAHLLLRVPGERLAGVVEADDVPVRIDEQEDDRGDVDDAAGDLLLALELAEPLAQLVLEEAALGELADDREHLVLPARHHPRLEVAPLPVELELVLDRLRLAGLERPLDARHQRASPLGRDDVPDRPPDQLAGRPDERGRVALDVQVRAVARGADHQVRHRVEERALARLRQAEGAQAAVVITSSSSSGSWRSEESYSIIASGRPLYSIGVERRPLPSGAGRKGLPST